MSIIARIVMFIKTMFKSIFRRAVSGHSVTTPNNRVVIESADYTAMYRAQQKRQRRAERNLRLAAAGGMNMCHA